jgi:acyl carrier protein
MQDTSFSVRAEIVAQFKRVAEEHSKSLAPLADPVALFDTGLDSLCFAVIVARLEDHFGVDPFATAETVDFPVTVGDFIALYERAVAQPAAARHAAD